MILGTGIDIIEVSRVEKAAAKAGFMKRVFTERELLRFEQLNNDPCRIAGAFAAKEAVAKALGTGIGRVEWRDIEILHDEQGAPYAQLSGEAQREMDKRGGTRMHVSISHIRDTAAAQAIMEG